MVWAVIPARQPGEGKTRLAGVLSAGEREELARIMLAHVVETAGSARNVDRTCIVGSMPYSEVPLLSDPGSGLNPALQSALGEAGAAAASRMIVLHGDLPQLTVRDVELLAAASEGSLAIAPDRHGTGTNALSLPLPAASRFAFAFGPDSFARHQAEAERLALPIETIRSPGLAHDIDEPDDLPDAAELLQRSRH
jgi:2-phospho-L-lactate guanylyltransferase